MKFTEIVESLVAENDGSDVEKDLERKYAKSKGVLDKVTVTLRGQKASAFTKAAKYYDIIAREEEKLKEAREKLNENMKKRMGAIFLAEEAVLTRVIDTASLTLTLSKESEKTTINHKAILDDLLELAPELADKIQELTEKHTKVAKQAARLGKPKVKQINPDGSPKTESVNESAVSDFFSKLANYGKRLLNYFTNWGKQHDAKLDNIKQRAAAAGLL